MTDMGETGVSTANAGVKVSVVIPTLNSAATLEKCLASIRSNRGPYTPEIICVDGGSTDGTVDIARKYADVVLQPDTYYAGTNRNKGFRAARGDIICFTDSDCIVPPHWIENLVNGLRRLHRQDETIVGVGSGNVPLLENPSLVETAIAKTMRSPLVAFGARNVTTYPQERPVMHNPPMSSAYFKTVLEQSGGFAEEYAYGGEDVELDAKITGAGYKLYYVPDAVVYHKHRSSFRSFARQMFNMGRGQVRVGRKFRRYAPLYRYGPIALCLLTFSPFFFMPLGMALLNGTWVGLRERSLRLFPLITWLSLTFYVRYGYGEIYQLLGKEP